MNVPLDHSGGRDDATTNSTTGGSAARPAKPRRASSRRRVLKTSAAAIPTVMTLYSGTARALVSLTCQQKLTTNLNPNLFEEVSGADGLMRATVDVRTYTNSVNGGDIKIYFDDIDEVWRDYSLGDVVDLLEVPGDPTLVMIPSVDGVQYDLQETVDEYALVFVDENGAPVGVAHNNLAAGMFSSDSCLASLGLV